MRKFTVPEDITLIDLESGDPIEDNEGNPVTSSFWSWVANFILKDGSWKADWEDLLVRNDLRAKLFKKGRAGEEVELDDQDLERIKNIIKKPTPQQGGQLRVEGLSQFMAFSKFVMGLDDKPKDKQEE